MSDPLQEQALREGTVVAGRFRIESLISEGGTSFVYRATDLELGRAVGLKVMLQQYIGHAKRFENEARAMSALVHPAVVRVYGLGVLPDRRPYLAMEFVPGETLGDRLDREGSLDPTEAVRILAPVCGALVEAHQQGIRHRDIKPDNIMIQPMVGGLPNARVLDFGIAGFDRPRGKRITRAGQIMGTPDYMAPEQAQGEEAGSEADIWSLGVVLYHMLAGTVPFDANNIPEVLYRVVQSEPDPLPRHTPVVLQRIVRDCLQKDPAKRPSGVDVLGRLESFLLGSRRNEKSSPVQAIPTAQFKAIEPEAPPPPAPRRGGGWLLGALLGLVIGAGGVWAVLTVERPGTAGASGAVASVSPLEADLAIADRLLAADMDKAAGAWLAAHAPESAPPRWAFTAALANLKNGYLRPSIAEFDALFAAHPALKADPRLVPAVVGVLRYKRGKDAMDLLAGPLWPAAKSALLTEAAEGVNSRARHRAIEVLAGKDVAVETLRLQAWRADLSDEKAACKRRKAAFDALIKAKDAASRPLIEGLDRAGRRCLGDALATGLDQLGP